MPSVNCFCMANNMTTRGEIRLKGLRMLLKMQLYEKEPGNSGEYGQPPISPRISCR